MNKHPTKHWSEYYPKTKEKFSLRLFLSSVRWQLAQKAREYANRCGFWREF